MPDTRCVYLFGDQTGDFDTGLRDLFQRKNNSLLTCFFERCYYAIRQEITRLPPSQQEGFPRFTNVVELLARYRESSDNVALGSALTCIYQLGCFINYYGDLGHRYPSNDDSCLIGLCTGLLSAAAVSCSKTVGDLIPIAVDTVVMALRLGLCVARIKDIVAPSEVTCQSWCALVSGIDERDACKIIDRFSSKRALPCSSRPYISAVSSNTLTISAPPMLLDTLIDTCLSREYKPIKVPIYGPYHAGHLYDNRNVERILELSSDLSYFPYVPHIPVFSNSTGKPIKAEHFGLLVKVCVEEILLRQLCWDRVTDSCFSTIDSTYKRSCVIFPISATAAQSLCMALKRAGVPNVDIDNSITETPGHSSCDNSSGRAEYSKIAIIGFAGRFPDASNPERFWNILHKGLDVHRKVPPDRWDVNAHVDMAGAKTNSSKIPYGCWINEPGLFDSRFFNMSPREALQADPAQRLALLTAYEALEMAGLVPDSTPSTQRNRVGIFYGMTSDDYREVNSGQDIDTYFIPGGNRAFTPGRINYHFKFSGPSVSVDTACSSSLAAIHMACNSIWKNDCDTAIAGGVNVLTNPDNHAGLDRGHFLSRTGNCNTFDDGADGYCRADGVGTVILKRLEDAQADNDPIQGVIVGACTNHSAESISITRPHVGAQAYIFEKLLNESNVDPKEISYIEMHGTGTQAGDAVEMQSVLDVFAPDNRRGTGQPLYLGSAKANIGHGESASGVTSLVKILLMMKENEIPPHCGIKTRINHNFPTDLQQRNVHIAYEPIQWDKMPNRKRKVFVNNFSAAGGNTALLIEDAPLSRHGEERDPRSVHTVVISARTQSALKNNINALLRYINENSKIFSLNLPRSLADLSYTTTARRIHHPFRAAAVGSTLKEITDSFATYCHRENTPVSAQAPSVGFVFTGQGAQYTGMGRGLYENCSQFRTTIQHLDCICQKQEFPSIIPLIDGSAPVEELSPLIVQLGTTCFQIALCNYWVSLGVKPTFALGHSLGDYAAMYAAGVLTASDTIYLCGSRAQLLTKQCRTGTHSMLAAKASLSRVKPFLNDNGIEVACINAPEETVISGPNESIDKLARALSKRDIKSTKLRLPFAFHSIQVEPILDSLEQVARGVVFHKPSIPFISSLYRKIVTQQNSDILGPHYLVRHCRETVNFLGALEETRHQRLTNDKTIWLEVGSHPICSGMVKAAFGPHISTMASHHRNDDTWRVLSTSLSFLYLAGININWKEYHQSFNASHQVLELPAYNWDLKNYWIPYNNNFCLMKGAFPTLENKPLSSPTFLSTSAQKIIETCDNGSTAIVVVENNIAKPELNRVIQGHKVNGVALCPSSLYADIAQTLAHYLIEKYQPKMHGSGLDVCNVTVPKPLIANGSSEQLFRVSATANWGEGSVSIQVFSVNSEGVKLIDHANCLVKFFDCNTSKLEWKRITYLVKRSIDRLQESADKGESHRITRGMVYKLFSALVDYDANYKSIEEVILDSDQYEATALVKLQAPRGNFHRNPFWIDSFGHLSGFVMNASDTIDSKTHVFVSHGWDSMRCLKEFSPDITYRTYVRMQPWQSSIWAGDVFVFEGDDIIAVYGGVKFQQLERKLLDIVLPPARVSRAATPVKSRPSPINPQKANASADSKASSSHPATSLGLNMTSRILGILEAEIGLPESEMVDDLVFADYGVDSLLSLTVTGKVREELGIGLESSVFVDYPTIKDFKKLLAQLASDSSDGSSSEPESTFSSNGVSTDASSAGCSGYLLPPDKEEYGTENTHLKAIRSILADEIGVPPYEISGEDNLAEMGMDSLLTLTVLGRIRETLDLDLPGDFFLENKTLDNIQNTLELKPETASESAQSTTVTPDFKSHAVQHPPATSLLLQGNPKTATKKLFLFPDGSGSATSYATIPGISPDICVYGLNCPYMKAPQKLTCSLDELTPPYVAEIRRRQPKGPYNLGGWSAGGICAYDAARYLIVKEGETVERLLLLDTPFPIGLEKLPPRLYSFFNSIGLFGEGKTPPSWLLPHFLAFIDSLDAYKASPFPLSDAELAKEIPKTFLIWAKDGVCGKPGDPRPAPASDGSKDPREMIWLLNDRVDLGPNGWDKLVGEDNIGGITVMEGANHFTMMKGDKGRELARFIRGALVA